MTFVNYFARIEIVGQHAVIRVALLILFGLFAVGQNALQAQEPEAVAGFVYSEKGEIYVLPDGGVTTVPELSGLTAKAAKEMLDKEGLTCKFQLGKAASTPAQALKVAQSEPAAGSQVARGTSVTITLFSPGSGAGAADTVPDVLGLSAPQAKKAIEDAGFKARFQLGNAAPSKEKALTAYDTSPAVGAKAARGDEILVKLYTAADGKNPEPDPKDAVSVPDCLTLSLDEATAKLKAAGLVVTTKAGRAATFAGQIDRVYEMVPSPGTRVRRGEPVQLLIYGNRKETP